MSFFMKKDNVYILTINNTTISLSAFIVLITGIILSILNFIKKGSIIKSLFMIFGAIFLSYQINCLEFGKCNDFAWMYMYVYLVISAFTIYTLYKDELFAS